MADKRRIETGDLFQIKLVNDPDVSPDGMTVVFTVTALDLEENRYRAALWQVDLDGGEPKRMTSGQHCDGQPQWSPDGQQIAFASDRDPDESGKGQLWLLQTRGGEPRRLTTLESSVESFSWSPDERSIVCVSKVRERPAKRKNCLPRSRSSAGPLSSFVSLKRATVCRAPANPSTVWSV